MKNIYILMAAICIMSGCQTKKNIFSSSPFKIHRNIIKIRENEKVYLLIANNNDIIEVFKPHFQSSACKKIVLNKRYTFKVSPVSDLIQKGIESPNEYILNDSTIIKYRSYYSSEESQLICK